MSHSSIVEKIKEKHEKQTIEIVDRFGNLTLETDRIMTGSFSWYWMQQKRKQLLRPFALNFEGVISTPSELARTYLELNYKKQRATSEQISYFKASQGAPLYAKPHKFEEGVYIDIRSAYWQILQIVGWDADYNQGKWLGRGAPMDNFPYADIKLSRNCLVTAGLPSLGVFWDGEKQTFKSIPTHNRSANLGIWSLTMDILHGVAWDAIAAGAVYAHTDGYICASERAGAVIDAIRGWGLETRIKASGETTVYGVGSYSIGAKSTNNTHKEYAYDNLVLSSYRMWLKRKVKFFAERTKFLWVSTWKQEKSSSQ